MTKYSNKNLIVDIDGVVAQYDYPTILKKHFNVDVPNHAVWAYGLDECLGLPPTAVQTMFKKEAYAPPNMIEGAREALERFIIKDYNVCIFSNRLKFMSYAELEEWLNKNDIPYSCILNGSGLPNRAIAAVDDSPSKLLAIDEEVTLNRRLLFDQPWNRMCLDVLGKFKRVKDWRQVLEEVNGFRG